MEGGTGGGKAGKEVENKQLARKGQSGVHSAREVKKEGLRKRERTRGQRERESVLIQKK